MTNDQPYFAAKLFRIRIANQLKLPYNFIENMFPFIVLNSGIATWFITKSLINTVLTMTYSGLCIVIYGEGQEFTKAMKFDLPQCLYARTLHDQKLQSDRFQSENHLFLQKYQLVDQPKEM